MIAKFDPHKSLAWLWTAALMTLLGCVALTDSAHGQFKATGTPGNSDGRAAKAPEPVIDASQTDADILEKIQKRLPDANFKDMPLCDVIDSLAAASGANMTVRWGVLESAGLDRKAPVSFKARNVTVEQALDHVLSDAGGGNVALGFDIDKGTLLVSTNEDLGRLSSIAFYDIGDLLRRPVPPTTQPSESEQVDSIIKVIEDLINSDAWKDNGGTVGSIREFNHKLIVQATPKMQREIQVLLDKLRETPVTSSTPEPTPSVMFPVDAGAVPSTPSAQSR